MLPAVVQRAFGKLALTASLTSSQCAMSDVVSAPRPTAAAPAAAASAACTLTGDGPVRRKDETSAKPRGSAAASMAA